MTANRTKYRWVVLLITILMYTVSFADRVNMGVVLPVVRNEFGLTNMQAGELASVYFIGFLITMLPFGFLMGKFGTRGVIGFAIMGFSAFTYLIGTARSAFAILCFRIGMGAAEAPIAPGGVTVIKNWHPKHEQATASGLYMGASTLGQLVVPPLAVWIMMNYGWRHVFYWFAIPGFILGVVWWIFTRSKPEQSPYCNAAEQEYIKDEHGQDEAAAVEHLLERDNTFVRLVDKLVTRKPVKLVEKTAEVFFSKNIWGLALGFCFINFLSTGMIFWTPAFLVEGKGMSFAYMGWVAAAQPLGGCFGCVIGGLISDKLLKNRRKANLLFTPMTMIVMMLLLIYVPNDPIMLSIVLFLTGFFLYSAFSCYYSYTMLITTAKTYPLAAALTAFVGNISGLISPTFAGYLVDVYKNYDPVFIFFAAAALISFLCIAVITEPSEVKAPA
ncbi:MAG: garP 1 [Firmicutes bacterium]|nr:garP 1 [Bacillota bacterium]